MKLNGGFTATVTGVLLASTIGWNAYIGRKLGDTSERLARVETQMQDIDKQFGELRNKLSGKFESIHRGIAELLALANGKAPAYDNPKPQKR